MWRVLERLGIPSARAAGHPCGRHQRQGSTIAFLRAMLEAAGKSVHVYTSPNLVRVNERFRLGAGGGVLVSDDELAERCRMRARQRRRADHAVRDRDRGGLRAVRAPSGRHAAARGRPRRAARRHQRDRASARQRRDAGVDGPLEFLGDTIEKIAAEKAGIFRAACRR
jgi:dihydrofolate synthase/folylpolyglutamate synthase